MHGAYISMSIGLRGVVFENRGFLCAVRAHLGFT